MLLIIMRLYHDIYWKILYFCSQELWLIINAYFDFCNMDATSGANVLIVNDS